MANTIGRYEIRRELGRGVWLLSIWRQVLSWSVRLP
jgi:hypothetical protein